MACGARSFVGGIILPGFLCKMCSKQQLQEGASVQPRTRPCVIEETLSGLSGKTCLEFLHGCGWQFAPHHVCVDAPCLGVKQNRLLAWLSMQIRVAPKGCSGEAVL
eukprot:1151831-Amphidinium_carterae.1